MARTFNNNSLKILKIVSEGTGVRASELFTVFGKAQDYKSFYNNLYRLIKQGLLKKEGDVKSSTLLITEEGIRLINRFHPEKDDIWKIVIFDIPEQQKFVRTVLRSKLKSLGFKKWQNSIWISPYKLDPDIESELKELGSKFFVRLIKTKEINVTGDLEKLFAA